MKPFKIYPSPTKVNEVIDQIKDKCNKKCINFASLQKCGNEKKAVECVALYRPISEGCCSKIYGTYRLLLKTKKIMTYLNLVIGYYEENSCHLPVDFGSGQPLQLRLSSPSFQIDILVGAD